MIGDPAPLTVRRDFPRPSAQQLAAFADVPTGFVVDAQNGTGALDHRIKPLVAEGQFAAPAMTCNLAPRDSLPVMPAIHLAQAGDVLVIGCQGFDGAAAVGDNVAQMAHNQGIVAIVTDGLVRDVDGLLAVGLPIFSCGVSPNSPYKSGPGDIGLRVAMGSVSIDPGDPLIGDRDGVVVVPRAGIDTVSAALDEVRAAEAKLGALVKGGATTMDWVPEYLDSDQTRYVD